MPSRAVSLSSLSYCNENLSSKSGRLRTRGSAASLARPRLSISLDSLDSADSARAAKARALSGPTQASAEVQQPIKKRRQRNLLLRAGPGPREAAAVLEAGKPAKQPRKAKISSAVAQAMQMLQQTAIRTRDEDDEVPSPVRSGTARVERSDSLRKLKDEGSAVRSLAKMMDRGGKAQ